MKAILIFFAVFLLINLISIYVMGGFYCQTIESKFITELFALISGVFVAVVYEHENKG
jgi:membrane associated rhomboid family serine protease